MRFQSDLTRREVWLTGIICLLLVVTGLTRELSLIDAVRKGDREAVRSLLQKKADVNEAGGDGMAPLLWAVYGGEHDLAQMLIRAGANVNARSTRGLTPLVLAADHSDPVLIRLLLKAGANPNLTNALGTTPLMRASAAGDVESVTALLDHGADVNARETARNQTALMFAAARDRAGVIRTLAARGAELNAHSRAVANAANLVDEAGNPIPAESRTGETQRRTRGDGLANGLGGRTALQFAAREGLASAARALVEAGADINSVNPLDGSTALVVAIANGHYDLAKYLLLSGADPNLAMKDGLAALYATIESRWAPVSWTPTAFTAASGIVQQKTSYLDLMKALIASGADPNARTSKSIWFSPPHHNVSWVRAVGATPFWRAAQANDLAAMKLLVEVGANPKIATADETTPLAVAAGVGWAGNFSTNAPDAFLPATRYLLEEIGIDVNTANAAGYTALMGAAWRGDNQLVEYLVAKGARLDARNRRGWSATDMANGPFIRGSQVPVKYPQTMALLRKLGAPELVANQDEVLGGGRSGGGRRDPDAADPDASDDAEPKAPQRGSAGR
jgi:ankyrin repeat protein